MTKSFAVRRHVKPRLRRIAAAQCCWRSQAGVLSRIEDRSVYQIAPRAFERCVKPVDFRCILADAYGPERSTEYRRELNYR